MSESALTPHTAPRNLEGLLKETPFKLRLLAQALNGLTTEEQKMAWHQLQTPEARAQYILSLLQGWDGANPGAARPMTNGTTNGAAHAAPPPQQQYAQPPPQQQAPPPQYAQQPQQQQYAQPQGQPQYQQPQGPPPQQFQAPVQQQFQMPQQPMAPVGAAQMGPPPVAPAAAAAATAATAAPTTSGRKPRNSAAAAAPSAESAELGAQVLTMLQQVLGGLGADADRFQKLQTNLTSILEEAAAAKAGRLTTLEGKYGEVANSLQHISAQLQSQSQLQMWTLMAFLTLAAEQTGAGVVDILGAAISDSAMFQQLVDKATGKAG